jgi:hypothetical protein
MGKGFGKYYNDLPPWAKGVVAVGGITVVGYAIYSFIRKQKLARDVKSANKISQEANQEIKVLQSYGIRPSYTSTQYESFALKLAESMNGCGTNENSIYSVFEAMKNKADVLTLISTFGVKFYSPCAGSQPISYAKYLLDDKSFGGNLSTWLQYDLTSGEIKQINNILSSKNIDFKF